MVGSQTLCFVAAITQGFKRDAAGSSQKKSPPTTGGPRVDSAALGTMSAMSHRRLWREAGANVPSAVAVYANVVFPFLPFGAEK